MSAFRVESVTNFTEKGPYMGPCPVIYQFAPHECAIGIQLFEFACHTIPFIHILVS